MTSQELVIELNEPTKSSWYKRPRDLGIIGFILFLLIVFLGGFLLSSDKSSKQSNKDEDKNEFIANSVLVYGYWNGNNAVISAIDLAKDNSNILAIIPTSSKHIRILSGNKFTYIGETDQYDYGRKLVLHTIDPASDVSVFETEEGFGIDDYVLSPSGDLAAVWVLGNPSDSSTVLGNKSRVYSLNLKTGESNMLYDEISSPSTPVHYPVGITDSGEVFLDKFHPNSGAGWAYGMSKTDFKGVTKEDIPSMKNGTYSSQPVMSQDGAYFAFAGYDGDDGTVEIDTYRKALINPNTVELLSVVDKTRHKITQEDTNSIYSLVIWDQLTDNLLISSTVNDNGTIVNEQNSYDPTSQLMEKIENSSPDLRFISFLQDKNKLFGKSFQDDAGMGNLGPYYSMGLNNLVVVDSEENSIKTVTLDQYPVQLIAVKTEGFFPTLSTGKSAISNPSNKQLSFQTFKLKSTLAQKRAERQSDPARPESIPNTPEPSEIPICRKIGYPQCNALLGRNYSITKDLGDLPTDDEEFRKCVWDLQQSGEAKNTCVDSPLYLYGEKGSKVNIYIGTEITNPNISISNNFIEAILDGNDGILVGGKRVDSIDFDYVSKLKKIQRPDYGYIVAGDKLQKKVKEIASELALNDKETTDILLFTSKIKAPFIFISHFDHQASHEILPLYFDPRPDTYRNIVFYFEELNSQLPHPIMPPIINPVIRIGQTAVEISYIIR